MKNRGGSVRASSPSDDQHLNHPVALAGTVDGHSLRLFVDGRQVDRTEFRNDFVHSGQKMSFGASPGEGEPHDGYNQESIGRLYEVRIANVAREKITSDVNLPLTSDDHTLAYYRVDEGSGDVFQDSYGNENHGSNVGATWLKAVESPASTKSPE